MRPADEIKRKNICLRQEMVIVQALNGIYRKLATFDLYGSNLKFGVDRWLGTGI